MNIKLGHQAPIGWRVNTYQYLTMDGEIKYNSKYNFVYDHKKESLKLHQGQACYFTDARFNAINEVGINGNFSFLSFNDFKGKDISHKAAIRKILKCKGFPVGTLIRFTKNWRYEDHRFLDNSFIFKVKKPNPVSITYSITEPSFLANLTLCDKAQELVVALRNNGFFVSVIKNTSNDYEKWQEVAIAYGHGKRVSFSPIGMPVQCCYYELNRILWDTHDNFGKWSKCNYILMSLPTEDILSVLLKNDEKDINWCTLT